MRVLDRLDDTLAQVMTDLGETLRQTRPAVALFGDQTAYTGMSRAMPYRWFTDLGARDLYSTDQKPLCKGSLDSV